MTVDEGVYVSKDTSGFLGSACYVDVEEESVSKVDSEIFY